AGILTAKGGGAGGYDMTSSNFGQTILGEATNDCVTKLASTITDKTGTMPTKFLNIEARVAALSGSTVTINAGSDAGVQVGDKFEISKVVREIKDPGTGEVLDLEIQTLGELTIADVRPRISSGNYVGTAVENNFVARKKKP